MKYKRLADEMVFREITIKDLADLLKGIKIQLTRKLKDYQNLQVMKYY